MRLAIYSASAAVRRTLELAVAQSGHHLATAPEEANLSVIDMIHPLDLPALSTPTLRLVTQPTSMLEDSLSCPLRPQSLIQRLMMLGSVQTLALGNGWRLDTQTRALHHDHAASIPLTEKECALLKQLAATYPAPLGRDDLLEDVWGVSPEIDTHTLETHIYRLRTKLEAIEPTPCDIVTREGAYLLALDAKNR